jgi:AbiV family abortive infection protein
MKSLRPLSIDEVIVARQKVRENARALVTEAELLLRNGAFARAYFVGYAASEELGKLPMLGTAISKLAAGKEVNWKRLGQRLRSHGAKILMVAQLDYIHDPDPENQLQRLQRDMEMAPTWLNIREWCLYSDLVTINDLDDGFKSPAEMIPQDLAETIVSLSRGRVGFWTAADEQLDRILKDPTKQVAGLFDSVEQGALDELVSGG